MKVQNERSSNYENIRHDEVGNGGAADTVGRSKRCIRWYAEGGESSPHKRPARVCIRVGHGFPDPAEGENQPGRDTDAQSIVRIRSASDQSDARWNGTAGPVERAFT